MKIRLNDVFEVHFTFDNQHLITSGGYDKLIRLWRINDGAEIGRFQGHGGHIYSIDLSPDGQTLISSSVDGTVRFWEVLTQKEYRRYTYSKKRQRIWCARIHREKNRVFASGQDGAVVIWPFRLLPKPVKLSDAEVQNLWKDLASADPKIAYAAIETLIVNPSHAIPLIQSGSKTNSLDVNQVKKLIKDLNARQFKVRDASYKKLQKMGKSIEGLLRDSLKQTQSAEQRQLVVRLLVNTASSTYSNNDLRLIRSIQILETIGSPKSHELLKKLAEEMKGNKSLSSIIRQSITRMEKNVD